MLANTALHCSTAGTSTNQIYGGDPWDNQQLTFKCVICGPMYIMANWGEGYRVVNSFTKGDRFYVGYAGGYSQQEGADRCTPCNATGRTGYSWRGLACNAT
jgi:hypothetical protein